MPQAGAILRGCHCGGRPKGFSFDRASEETADVPRNGRTHRVRRLRSSLALWLAVLLSIGPIAHGLLTPAPQPIPAAASYASATDAARQREGPALRWQGDGPDAGILPRLLHVDAALAPPPQKTILPKPHAGIDLPASLGPKARLGGQSSTALHRSSIGTARAPTGPPA